MSRRRGNLFSGSYNEELREALAANPNFVQAQNCRGSYVSTRAEVAAAAAPDASDPPYTPSAKRADTEGSESPVQAASSQRRSKRLRPFYVDRVVEPASANRRTRETRELLTTRETVREGLLVIQISSASDSEGSVGRLAGRTDVAGRSTRSASYEFADDIKIPSTNASAPRSYIIPESPQWAANCASVSIVTAPRAHRRKQNRPYRCPVI